MTGFIAKARKLAGILAVPAWRAALGRHGVAAGVEHAGVLRNLGPVRTVVDIGANRSQFALAARYCFADARRRWRGRRPSRRYQRSSLREGARHVLAHNI